MWLILKAGPLNLSREDLALLLAKKTLFQKADTALMVDALIDIIVEQYQAGNTIEIRGLGTFYPFFKKERTYTVPRIKKEHGTPSYTTLKFKPSKKIRIY